VARRPIIPPKVPPTIEPIGVAPMTRNFMVAFIRPWSRSGVMDWRRLTWLMP
jgi:hypothetical protein